MNKYIAVKHEMQRGGAYTLKVYVNHGKAKGLELVGKSTVQYGRQFGEKNEAWQIVLSANPRIKACIEKAGCQFDPSYFHSEYEDAGIVDIQII